MRRLDSILLALLCLGCLAPLSLRAASAQSSCKLGRLAELHVTMNNRSPMVTVKFNGLEAQMLVDSGAFYSLISSAAAAQFKLRTSPAPFDIRISGIDGGSSGVSMTTVKEFTMADAKIPGVEFLVGGSETGNGAAGMLGQNVLSLADAEYDLANGAIRLMRPHDCRKANLAYWAGAQPYSELDIEGLSSASMHTVGSATLNGAKLRVMFDTGAYSSILSLRAAARAGIKPGDANVVPAGESTGIGMQPVTTWIAPFASFKIGDEEIRNARLRIGAIRLEDVDMLIGVDFFLSHHIYVANDQQKIYFTYNGGPVFNLTTKATTPPDATPAPPADAALAADAGSPGQMDAAALERRGAAEAARHDYEHALADLTRACELEPKAASHFYQRGQVYARAGQTQRATEDFNQTLTLNPADVNALVARAELLLAADQKSQATADLEAASRLLAAESDLQAEIAALYMEEDEFAPAIAHLDLWLDAHRDDVKRASALNERCWARALWNRELERAEADCNASLRLRTRASAEYAAVLDSRGLVRLRRGNFAGAVADYDAALARLPTIAWSLFGRGIAKLRLGKIEEGQADLAAASKQKADIVPTAARYGITP